MNHVDAPEPDPDYTADDAYELACADGSITADPDSVEVRIGCDHDNEADAGQDVPQPAPDAAPSVPCSTCGEDGGVR